MIHMILWAKPKPLDIDGMADVVYPMLELLKAMEKSSTLGMRRYR